MDGHFQHRWDGRERARRLGELTELRLRITELEEELLHPHDYIHHEDHYDPELHRWEH